jgi:hypothetical protein
VNTSPFIDICNDFYMTPKAQGTKAKTDKWDHIKLKKPLHRSVGIYSTLAVISGFAAFEVSYSRSGGHKCQITFSSTQSIPRVFGDKSISPASPMPSFYDQQCLAHRCATHGAAEVEDQDGPKKSTRSWMHQRFPSVHSMVDKAERRWANTWGTPATVHR